MLAIIFLIFAFVCFCLSAFNVPSSPRVNLQSLGLAFWVLSLLVPLLSK